MRKLLLILLILSFGFVGSVEAYNILGGQQSYVGSNCSCTAFYGIPNFENGLSIFGPLSFYPNGYVATNMPFTTTSALGISYGTSAVVSNGGLITINGGVYETGMLLTGQTVTIPTFTIGDVNQLENYNLGFFGSPFTSFGTPAGFSVLDPATAYPTLGNWYAYPLPGWNFTFTIPGFNISIPTMSGYYGMYDPLNSMDFNGFGGIRNFYIVPEYNYNSFANPQSFDFRYGGVLEIAGLSPSYYELYVDPFNVSMQSGSAMTIASNQTMTISSSGDLNLNANNIYMSSTIINGNQTVDGNQTVNGSQAVNNDQTVNGNQTVNGSQAVNNGQTVNGNQTVVGNQLAGGDSSAMRSFASTATLANFNFSGFNISVPVISHMQGYSYFTAETTRWAYWIVETTDGFLWILGGSNYNNVLVKTTLTGSVITSVVLSESNVGLSSNAVIDSNNNIYVGGSYLYKINPSGGIVWQVPGILGISQVILNPLLNQIYSVNGSSPMVAINDATTGSLITIITLNPPNGDKSPWLGDYDQYGYIWIPFYDDAGGVNGCGTTVAKISTSTYAVQYFTFSSDSYTVQNALCGGNQVLIDRSNNYVYISAVNNADIVKMDYSGNIIAVFHSPNEERGWGTHPRLVFDNNGNLWATMPTATNNTLIAEDEIDKNTGAILQSYNFLQNGYPYCSNFGWCEILNPLVTSDGIFAPWVGTSATNVAIINTYYFSSKTQPPIKINDGLDISGDITSTTQINIGIYGNGQTVSTIGVYDNDTGSYNMSHTVNYDTQQLTNGCATVNLSLPFLANQYSCTFNYISHNYSVGIPTFTFTTNSFTVCTTTNNGSINTLDNNFFTGICTGY